MDITTARSLLTQVTASRADEVAALQLATDLLDSTYKAEFDSLNNAKAEADHLAGELNTARTDKATAEASLSSEQTAHANDVAALTSEKSALSTAYDNAIAEKDTLITESVAKDTKIEDLQSRVDTLTPKETLLVADPVALDKTASVG